jgi:putative flippase GtrA
LALNFFGLIDHQDFYELFLKFLKFGLVGLSGTLVDFGTTYLLKEKAKIHKYLANSCGFLLAATSNYIFNRLWTFHSTDPQYFHEYFRFILVSAVGLGINNLVLWYMVSKRNRRFYFSKLVATIITMIWNFGANMAFTFYHKP